MKKKRSCLLKLLLFTFAGCVALILLWSVVNIRPTVRDGQPLTRIAPEITFIEGPLNDDGDVNYLEALNQELSAGVTPETNAVVKFLQALGPEPEGSPLPAKFYEKLGVAPLAIDGSYYEHFEGWLREQGLDPSEARYTKLVSHWEFAMTGPWSPETFPELNRWCDEMAPQMELVRQGSLREHYYHPLVVSTGERDSVISALLSVVQQLREFARFYSIRSMRSLEAGDVDAAFEDVLTMWRVGRQVRNGGTLIEQLVGIAVQGIATGPLETICASGKPTSKQLMDFLKEFDEIPESKKIDACIELTERYMMLDIVVAMGRGRTEVLTQMGGLGPRKPNQLMNVAFKTIDWEECLKVCNIWYERIVADSKVEGFEARSAAFVQLENDMMALQRKQASPSNLVLTAIGGRKAKGQLMAESLVTMLAPALQQVSAAEVRSDAYRKRSRILIALTAFEKDNGQFPKSLDELAPKYLASIPNDPFTNKPFKFSMDKDELGNPIVVLYSVGANQTDELGADMSSNGDDWPVQWYVPTWESFEAEKIQSANAWFDEDEDGLEAGGGDSFFEEDDLPPKPRAQVQREY